MENTNTNIQELLSSLRTMNGEQITALLSAANAESKRIAEEKANAKKQHAADILSAVKTLIPSEPVEYTVKFYQKDENGEKVWTVDVQTKNNGKETTHRGRPAADQRDPRLPKPGTTLNTTINGSDYVLQFTEGQEVIMNGAVYKRLSAAAHQVVGTGKNEPNGYVVFHKALGLNAQGQKSA